LVRLLALEWEGGRSHSALRAFTEDIWSTVLRRKRSNANTRAVTQAANKGLAIGAPEATEWYCSRINRTENSSASADFRAAIVDWCGTIRARLDTATQIVTDTWRSACINRDTQSRGITTISRLADTLRSNKERVIASEDTREALLIGTTDTIVTGVRNTQLALGNRVDDFDCAIRADALQRLLSHNTDEAGSAEVRAISAGNCTLRSACEQGLSIAISVRNELLAERTLAARRSASAIAEGVASTLVTARITTASASVFINDAYLRGSATRTSTRIRAVSLSSTIDSTASGRRTEESLTRRLANGTSSSRDTDLARGTLIVTARVLSRACFRCTN